VLQALQGISTDINEVVGKLEPQGLASFAKSWDELIASATNQLDKAGAEAVPSGAVKPTSPTGGADGSAPASVVPRETTAG